MRRASSPDPRIASEAFSDLYESYWPPLLGFLRNSGQRAEDAEDALQDYFVDVKRRGFFGKASPDAGRLRSFLIADLKYFLNNRRRKETAERRGGGAEHYSFEELTSVIEDEKGDPEAHYDRQWALCLLERARAALEAEYQGKGKQAVFEAYADFLAGGAEAPNHRQLARKLEISEENSRALLKRLREKFSKAIISEIRKTVTTRKFLEEEYRFLRSLF